VHYRNKANSKGMLLLTLCNNFDQEGISRISRRHKKGNEVQFFQAIKKATYMYECVF